MENTKNSSSVLLSIFKRKGGEGLLTKIITDANKVDYLNQLLLLKESENALLCYKEDELNWLLLTTNRILEEKAGINLSIPFSELLEVNLAVQEEFEDKITSKEDFTRLVLRNRQGGRYLIKLEKGKPFQGIYQMLHHLVSISKM